MKSINDSSVIQLVSTRIRIQDQISDSKACAHNHKEIASLSRSSTKRRPKVCLFQTLPSPDPQIGLLSLHNLGLSGLTQFLLGWFCLPSARKHKVLLRTPLQLSSSKAEVGWFTCQSNRDGFKDRRGPGIHQGCSSEKINAVSLPRRLHLMFSPC